MVIPGITGKRQNSFFTGILEIHTGNSSSLLADSIKNFQIWLWIPQKLFPDLFHLGDFSLILSDSLFKPQQTLILLQIFFLFCIESKSGNLFFHSSVSQRNQCRCQKKRRQNRQDSRDHKSKHPGPFHRLHSLSFHSLCKIKFFSFHRQHSR